MRTIFRRGTSSSGLTSGPYDERKYVMTCRNRTAFTLLELILMVSILGILLSIAVPRLKFDTLARYKADTVARKIVTDLRRTRSLAIGEAATTKDGYRLG